LSTERSPRRALDTARSACAPFRFRRLPVAGNSENIGTMKSWVTIRCLVIATMSLVGAWPLAGTAQDNVNAFEAPPAAASVPRQRFVSDKLVLNVYAE